MRILILFLLIISNSALLGMEGEGRGKDWEDLDQEIQQKLRQWDIESGGLPGEEEWTEEERVLKTPHRWWVRAEDWKSRQEVQDLKAARAAKAEEKRLAKIRPY